MIRRKTFALLILCVILSGCAAQKTEPTQSALDFRTALMEAGGCSFTAQITADYGERVYAFTAACDYTAAGAVVTVLEPEAIAGIKAIVSEDGAKIDFDGTELDFGQLANGFLSPVSSPWLMGQCWTQEYIAYGGKDGDWERITYLRGYHDEEVSLDTWLDASLTPVRGEFSYDGVRCLTVLISDFRLNS